MDSLTINQQLDDACARVAVVTQYPSFAGGTYVFEPPNLAEGTWLRLGGEPLPGELAIRVPPMPGSHPVVRRARCRVLLEDALARHP